MIYLFYHNPFVSRQMYNIEKFNEMCIQLSSIAILLLSTPELSATERMNYGWGMIGCTVINVLINMVVALGVQLLSLRKSFSTFRANRAKS